MTTSDHDTKQAKMLERVRALLAKADSTEHPAEADAFRSKADQLMTSYAIDMWQVQRAQDGVEAPAKAARKDWDISWYVTSPVGDQLWNLFHNLAKHCRCLVVSQEGWVNKDGGTGKVPVIGMDSDLAYLDLLFTSLWQQMMKVIEPTPNQHLEYHENLRQLKEAGLSWPEIARLMFKHGLVDPTAQGTPERTRDKMIRDYRAYVKREAIPQSYNNHQTYRRNFAAGFNVGVSEQLRLQRVEQTKTTGMDLVVTGSKAAVEAEVKAQFPNLKPVRYSRDNRKSDWAAREAGAAEGRKANVMAHQDRRMGSRKQLES